MCGVLSGDYIDCVNCHRAVRYGVGCMAWRPPHNDHWLTSFMASYANRQRMSMQLLQALITVADANAIKGKRVLINNSADKDSRVLTAWPGQWHCLNYKASL